MKKAGLFIFVAVLAMLLGAVPAFAGKKALSENDLDLVTAAGQPAVLIAATFTYQTTSSGVTSTFSGAGAVTFNASQEYSLTAGSTSQASLRALVLNNVVGENQVANALNIQAAPGSGSPSQSNEINQSWGSTLDVGGSNASGATITISGKCIACTNNAGTAGGNGTIDVSGKAIATTNNAGGSAGSRRSIYADEIFIGSTITKRDDNQFNLTLLDTAQQNLAALLVNNVIGLNLVANGVNISSGAVNLGTDPALASSSNAAVAQTNTVRQYRGTPLAHP